MTPLEAFLLGLIQGITEWLPVSSSGHLAIARHLLGLEVDTFYDLMLHVATLLAVLWVMRMRVAEIFMAVVRTPQVDAGSRWADPHRRMFVYLFAASLPIGVAGFLLEARIEAAFGSMRAVGSALLLTSLFLVASQWSRPPSPLTLRTAFGVGLAQVLALFPGVSRSGTTMAAGIMQGLDRESAADFAFLLAIPALVGATLFKASSATAAQWTDVSLWIGFATSLLVGYASLSWLLGSVKRHGIHHFAWYTFPLGLVLWLMS